MCYNYDASQNEKAGAEPGERKRSEKKGNQDGNKNDGLTHVLAMSDKVLDTKDEDLDSNLKEDKDTRHTSPSED